MTEQEMRTLHRKIDAGVKAAIAQAIEQHRKLGQSAFCKMGLSH